MHSLFPNTLIRSTENSSTNCFPTSTQQKNSPRNPKEITKTWLVLTTLHNAHQGHHLPQQSPRNFANKQGSFKLINNNILHFKFCLFVFLKDFKELHQGSIKWVQFLQFKRRVLEPTVPITVSWKGNNEIQVHCT